MIEPAFVLLLFNLAVAASLASILSRIPAFQRMLLREGATELARTLDPDASWPALERVTADVEAWLVAR